MSAKRAQEFCEIIYLVMQNSKRIFPLIGIEKMYVFETIIDCRIVRNILFPSRAKNSTNAFDRKIGNGLEVDNISSYSFEMRNPSARDIITYYPSMSMTGNS